MDDEQRIRDLVAAWIDASASGDDEQVLRLIADDVVFLMPGQPPMRKADFAIAQRGLKQFELQMTARIHEIRIVGEWAYCWNELRVSVTPRAGGSTITRAGNVLSILQKQGESWVIVRDANMLATISG